MRERVCKIEKLVLLNLFYNSSLSYFHSSCIGLLSLIMLTLLLEGVTLSELYSGKICSIQYYTVSIIVCFDFCCSQSNSRALTPISLTHALPLELICQISYCNIMVSAKKKRAQRQKQ